MEYRIGAVMRKRGTRKIRESKKSTRSYKKVRRMARDTIRDSVSQMRTVSRLDRIVIESIDTDSWGDITICDVKGYIEVQVKTGVFSTKPGKKVFTATVKAKTGDPLAINWEPGEIN